MRIAVCIKQVPVVSAMTLDPVTRTLKREGVRTEVSAFDVRALIKALELKQTHGGEVVVLSMGPPQAREALDRMPGARAPTAPSTSATAPSPAPTRWPPPARWPLALRRESPDLILCGRNSVDAETGQVGPEVAELLDIPQITGARALDVDAAAQTDHRRARDRRWIRDGLPHRCRPWSPRPKISPPSASPPRPTVKPRRPSRAPSCTPQTCRPIVAVWRCRFAHRGHWPASRSRRHGSAASSTPRRSTPRPRSWCAS